MPTLIAIGYPNQQTAEQAWGTVRRLEEELIIQTDQVAVVTRDPDGTYHVHTSHDGISTAGGAIWGGFWGLLFGTLFLIPFAGWAMGAGLGALFGHTKEKGINQQFQQQVRDQLQPGAAALFMVIEHATPDKAIAALAPYGGTVIRTTLSDEDTKKLEEALRSAAPVAARLWNPPRHPIRPLGRQGDPRGSVIDRCARKCQRNEGTQALGNRRAGGRDCDDDLRHRRCAVAHSERFKCGRVRGAGCGRGRLRTGAARPGAPRRAGGVGAAAC